MDYFQIILKKLSSNLKQINVDAGTILLDQDKIANKIFFIEKGCLRQYITKDGTEITLQFFMEEDMVSSADSFRNNVPSRFVIESIEPSNLLYISKTKFKEIVDQNPELRTQIEEHIFGQLIYYQQLFLSRIMYSPQERYQELLRNQPELIRRIPQKYLASYLGITPVSLSRIRSRK